MDSPNPMIGCDFVESLKLSYESRLQRIRRSFSGGEGSRLGQKLHASAEAAPIHSESEMDALNPMIGCDFVESLKLSYESRSFGLKASG